MSAGNVANFTGVLVRRHYKPGQKYVQFVFQTAEGIRLSLSRNVQTVRTLDVGQEYSVEGQEYVVAGKSFIHEPTALPIQARARTTSIRSRSRLIIAVAILLPVIGIASAIYFTTRDTSGSGQVNTSKVSAEKTLGASTTNTSASNVAPAPISNGQPGAAAAQSVSQPQPEVSATPQRIRRPGSAVVAVPLAQAVTPTPQAPAVQVPPLAEQPQIVPEAPMVSEEPVEAAPPAVIEPPAEDSPPIGEPSADPPA